MRLLALCISLVVAPALAQGKPTLVDHPLEVKWAATEAQATALQDDFRQLLARSSAVLLPTRTHWKSAVAALKRQDCDVRDECLQQLATTAGTLYALFVSVERNVAGTEVTARGRVVNQDGVEVRSVVMVSVKKKTGVSEAAREALTFLISKLSLDTLSPVLAPRAPEPKAVAAAEPKPAEPSAVPPPPPTPPPSEPARVVVAPPATGTAPLRIAAYVAGGLAVAGLAISAGFGISAASERARLSTGGLLLGDAEVRSQRAVNQGATLALGAGVAAAALAATAIAMFAASSPGTISVTVAPGPSGGALVVGGAF